MGGKKYLSAKKRARQAEKRRKRNKKLKLLLKKAIKEMLRKKDEESLRKAYSIIDKAKKRRIIHRNNASRKKSKLAKLLKIGGEK
jgi:small subunit ribosomal protein S20